MYGNTMGSSLTKTQDDLVSLRITIKFFAMKGNHNLNLNFKNVVECNYICVVKFEIFKIIEKIICGNPNKKLFLVERNLFGKWFKINAHQTTFFHITLHPFKCDAKQKKKYQTKRQIAENGTEYYSHTWYFDVILSQILGYKTTPILSFNGSRCYFNK